MILQIPKQIELPVRWVQWMLNIAIFALLLGVFSLSTHFLLAVVHGLFPGLIPTTKFYTTLYQYGQWMYWVVISWKYLVGIVILGALGACGKSVLVNYKDGVFTVPKLVNIAVNVLITLIFVFACIFLASLLHRGLVYYWSPEVRNLSTLDYYAHIKSIPLYRVSGELSYRMYMMSRFDPFLVVSVIVALGVAWRLYFGRTFVPLARQIQVNLVDTPKKVTRKKTQQ